MTAITAERLNSLIIFRKLLDIQPLSGLNSLLTCEPCDRIRLSSLYAEFAGALLADGGDLCESIRKKLIYFPNIYTDMRSHESRGAAYCASLERLLARELDILADAADFDGSGLRSVLGDDTLAQWEHSRGDFVGYYNDAIADIGKTGFGIFALYRAFVVGDNGELVPVRNPDAQKLEDFCGYERERGLVVANTRAFVEGRSANNVLLYGDAGTGKSSTVKAVANDFAPRGLRLVELKKNQIYRIPTVLDMLADNPLKFILYIDDLTFSADDRDFCTLKAILEGGINSRGKNILIYATSNHRHLVKETGADREGDALNVNDKVQEIVSLSARFGLTVTFTKSDRELYLRIVRSLAVKKGIEVTPALEAAAEAFALRAGGRNPRTAGQFIDSGAGLR